jgi:hypothetical protein
MNANNRVLEWLPNSELANVVEPLADFICASEQPEAVLRSILTVLCRQVNATNGLAASHFARSQRAIGQAV